ncbi:acyl-CoA-like ligand-binding transcription factor [Streptomyces tendae]
MPSPPRCGSGAPAAPSRKPSTTCGPPPRRCPGRDVGALLRLTRTEPGLRAVWLQTHDEAEPAFAGALAERAGLPADDVRPAIWAAMLNAALRAAVEHHAYRATGPSTDPAAARADLAETLRTALAVTAAGLT